MMADITMCQNNICPIRQNCYRYRAIPNEKWQSYSNFSFDNEKSECEHFFKITPHHKLSLNSKS